jgi:cell division inhibitor SepF
MGIFSKSKKEQIKSNDFAYSEKIEFLKLESVSDEQLLDIADHIKQDTPYIINFEFQDIDDINKSIAFLSGVCYALGGEVIQIKEKILVFGSQKVYEDGSIHTFIADFN